MTPSVRFLRVLASMLVLACVLEAGRAAAGPPFPWRPRGMGPAPYTQRQMVRTAPVPALPIQPVPYRPLEPTPLDAPAPDSPQSVTVRKPEASFPAGYGIHIVASERFLDQFIRVESLDDGPVRDCILGAEVVGAQSTETVVRINLVPDPQYARFDLVLQGTTRNQTENRTPQAVIHSEGNHHFEVAKSVQFDGQKLMTRSPSAWMYPCQRNRAAMTPASAIPILGPMMSQYALGIADQRRPEAERITATRITQQVAPQFDKSIDARLVSLNRGLQETLPQLLPRFGIEQPTTHVQTTENELRASLAWDSVRAVPDYQTPSISPDDAQLHLAIHAEAVNAWLGSLPLGGQEIAISDLARWQVELQRLLTVSPQRSPLVQPASIRIDRRPTRLVSDSLTLPGLGEPTVIGPILPPPRVPQNREESQKVPGPSEPTELPPAAESSLTESARMILARQNPIAVQFRNGEAVITIVASFQVDGVPPTDDHRIQIPLTSHLEPDALIVTPGKVQVDNATSSTGTFRDVVRNTIHNQIQRRLQPTRWPLERQFARDQGAPVTLRLKSLGTADNWLSFSWGVAGLAASR